MSTPPDPSPPPDAAVRNYTFLCLASLLVTLLALMVALPQAGPIWLLLPVLVGLGGVLLRWSMAPLLFLLALGLVLYVSGALRAPFHPQFRPPTGPSPATDLVLAVAALGYVAGHYRLQSLVRAVFPHDPRRGRGSRRRGAGPAGPPRPAARVPERRSPELAGPGEVVGLLLALPACGLLGLLAYRALVTHESLAFFGEEVTNLSYDGPALPVQLLTDALYRGRLLLWGLGVGVRVVGGLLRYAAWARASRAEAEVFLQDAVWRETRREQRLIFSWQVWGRWRRGRGREQP